MLIPPTLARMAHDGPCLRTSGIGTTDAFLRPRRAPESGKLGKVCRLPRLLRLQQLLLHYYVRRISPRLNDDIDHNTTTTSTSSTSSAATTSPTALSTTTTTPHSGYIDIGIHRHPLQSRLRIMFQSDRPRRSCYSRHYRSDCGGVLEYITARFILVVKV